MSAAPPPAETSGGGGAPERLLDVNSSPAPEKRTRGRPKKTEPLSSDSSEVKKGRRGRKKQPHAQSKGSDLLPLSADAGEALRYFSFQDESKSSFAAGDLVWGKVGSHPWWPGQVFPPESASEDAAQRSHKPAALLVAYFGDCSYAWNDASSLFPYATGFSALSRQHGPATFSLAVKASLDEIGRRVGFWFGSKDRLEDRLIVNAGIRDGTKVQNGDRAFAIDAFSPGCMLEFVSDVAVTHGSLAERLEIVIAKALLKGFNQWRGCLNVTELEDSRALENEEGGSPVQPKEGQAEVLDVNLVKSTLGEKKGVKRKSKAVLSDFGTSLENAAMASHTSMEGEVNAESAKGGAKGRRKANVKTKGVSSSDMEMKPEMQDQCDQSNNESIAERPKKGRRGSGSHVKFVDAGTSLNSEMQNAPTNGSGVNSAPRPRGRPKKVSVVKAASHEMALEGDGLVSPLVASSSMNSVINQNSAIATPKSRSRGRPKKVTVSVNNLNQEVDTTSYSAEEMLSLLYSSAEDSIVSCNVLPAFHAFFTKYKDSLVPSTLKDTELLNKLVIVQSIAKSMNAIPSGIASDGSLLFDGGDGISQDAPLMEGKIGPAKRGRKKKVSNVAGSSGEEPTPAMEPTSSGRKRKSGVKVNKKVADLFGESSDDPDQEPTSSVRKRKEREKGSYETKRGRKKKESEGMKPLNEPLPPVEALNSDQAVGNAELLNEYDEKPDEFMPTALTLNFSSPDAIPSKNELLEIFRVYGSLREEETEVMRSLNSAKVVFKHRADAERAYSSPARYSIFGSALLTYKLNFVTTPRKVSQASVSTEPPLPSEDIKHNAPGKGSTVGNFGDHMFGSNGKHG